MVGEVQADGDKLGHALDGQAIARRAIDRGQGGGVDRGDLCQTRRAQHVRRDVGDVAGQVADGARRIHQTGLFLALGAVTQQLHDLSLS
jgi:hypothetical protein